MPFTTETAKEAGSLSSRKGISNKTTQEIKEAYQVLIENNLDNMSTWLKKIGDENPEKAFDILIKLSDFIVPKLSRQELSIKEGMVKPAPKHFRDFSKSN